MESIKKFKDKKIENMATIVAGFKFWTNAGVKDKIKRNGAFITRVGWFDGPRD